MPNDTDVTLWALKESVISGNIPEMILQMMDLALQSRASDVHIEPQKNVVQVRYRIDGQLRVIIEYPSNMHPGMVSKLKIMANLKIDESRIPQDGRISTWIKNKEVDLRVSSLPTVNGEKICMRVLDKSKTIPPLSALGIVGHNYNRILKAVSLPNGIILTSGPTGSGKTTTLYSAMSMINKPDVNILTLEDPVENQMGGLNQSQVNPLIGYTFAGGLRTALRQDPDVIMVGEIRDKETIDIAIEASLTGHLVLSTIHTNSAVETITRILNMKVPDFLITSAVNLIIAQRLARKICPVCRIATKPSADTLRKIEKAFEVFVPYEGLDMGIFKDPTIYEPKEGGCDQCEKTGYHGRVGLYEVLTMGPEIKQAVNSQISAMEIQKIACRSGMVTLEQDGLIKILQGLSTLSEVYKLVKE